MHFDAGRDAALPISPGLPARQEQAEDGVQARLPDDHVGSERHQNGAGVEGLERPEDIKQRQGREPGVEELTTP